MSELRAWVHRRRWLQLPTSGAGLRHPGSAWRDTTPDGPVLVCLVPGRGVWSEPSEVTARVEFTEGRERLPAGWRRHFARPLRVSPERYAHLGPWASLREQERARLAHRLLVKSFWGRDMHQADRRRLALIQLLGGDVDGHWAHIEGVRR